MKHREIHAFHLLVGLILFAKLTVIFHHVPALLAILEHLRHVDQNVLSILIARNIWPALITSAKILALAHVASVLNVM